MLRSRMPVALPVADIHDIAVDAFQYHVYCMPDQRSDKRKARNAQQSFTRTFICHGDAFSWTLLAVLQRVDLREVGLPCLRGPTLPSTTLSASLASSPTPAASAANAAAAAAVINATTLAAGRPSAARATFATSDATTLAALAAARSIHMFTSLQPMDLQKSRLPRVQGSHLLLATYAAQPATPTASCAAARSCSAAVDASTGAALAAADAAAAFAAARVSTTLVATFAARTAATAAATLDASAASCSPQAAHLTAVVVDD